VAADTTLGFAAQRLLGGHRLLARPRSWWRWPAPSCSPATTFLAMAWADAPRRHGSLLLRNWAIVCGGQRGRGAAPWSVLVWASGHGGLDGGGDAPQQAQRIAAKLELPVDAGLPRAACCATCCVCTGGVAWRWPGAAVVDKVVAVVFPVTAFVAAGFEHSVADLYSFPWPRCSARECSHADVAVSPGGRGGRQHRRRQRARRPHLLGRLPAAAALRRAAVPSPMHYDARERDHGLPTRPLRGAGGAAAHRLGRRRSMREAAPTLARPAASSTPSATAHPC
jgi:hypothetical protein